VPGCAQVGRRSRHQGKLGDGRSWNFVTKNLLTSSLLLTQSGQSGILTRYTFLYQSFCALPLLTSAFHQLLLLNIGARHPKSYSVRSHKSFRGWLCHILPLEINRNHVPISHSSDVSIFRIGISQYRRKLLGHHRNAGIRCNGLCRKPPRWWRSCIGIRRQKL
jgi:hypothetical protein